MDNNKKAIDVLLHPMKYGIEDRHKAVEKSVQALKMQIPEKPDFEADGYAPDGSFVYDTWICPCCESRYEVDYDEYDFCPNCGQAIDWSDCNDR